VFVGKMLHFESLHDLLLSTVDLCQLLTSFVNCVLVAFSFCSPKRTEVCVTMQWATLRWSCRPLADLRREVELPNSVVLEITQTDPGVKGDTATGGTKPAIVETGAQVMVPLFLSIGEKIKIDTRTDSYLGREN